MIYKILRLLLSVFCFILVFYLFEAINYLSLFNSILNFGLGNFIILIALNLLSLAILFIRFSTLIEQLKISFSKKIFVVFNSNLFNILPIPGFVEAVKYNDIKFLAGKENSFYIVLLEKLSSILIYFSFIFCFYLFLNLNFFFFLIGIFILFFLFIYSFKYKYNIFYIGYIFQKLSFYYRNFNRILAQVFIYSFIMQFISIIVSLYVFYILGILNLDNLLKGIFVIILSNFISSIPVSILGFGIRDLSYIFLGTYFLAIPHDISILATSILNILVIFNQLVCFIISLFFFYKKSLIRTIS
jgi:hypothetical protein